MKEAKDLGDILDNKEEFSEDLEIGFGLNIAICSNLIWDIFMASYNIARLIKPIQVDTKAHVVETLYPGNKNVPRSFPNQYHICI